MRTNKIVSAVIAVFMAGVLAAGVCCLGFASRNKDGKWFGDFKNISGWHWSDKTDENKLDTPDNPDDKPVVDDKNNNGGALIGGVENNGISLMSARIAPTAYDENGISPQADTAYTLTATVTPDNATDKYLIWYCAWVNSSSTWANGKNIDDYISLLTIDSANVRVTIKQPFGEQIKVVVQSRTETEISACCTFDYISRLSSVTVLPVFGDTHNLKIVKGSATEDYKTFNINYGFTAGTLKGEYSITATCELSNKVKQELLEDYPDLALGWIRGIDVKLNDLSDTTLKACVNVSDSCLEEAFDIEDGNDFIYNALNPYLSRGDLTCYLVGTVTYSYEKDGNVLLTSTSDFNSGIMTVDTSDFYTCVNNIGLSDTSIIV